ncbi:MAG: hypothetical protein ACRELG_03720 [Gemmataceae bacterium]
MSVLLDLTDKRFGNLTAIALHPVRPKGKTLWRCLCKCGNEVLVAAHHLRSGAQRGCGKRCPFLRRKRSATSFTKAGMRAKVEATAIREDEEGIWYAPRKAAKYVKRTTGMLCMWRTACSLIDGRGIRTKQFPDGLNGDADYYLKCSKKQEDDPCTLDAVLAAQAKQQQKPICPDHTHLDDVCRELGLSRQAVRFRVRAMGRRLKRVRSKKFVSRRKGGPRAEPCTRSYVPNDVFDELKKVFPVVRPQGKVTVKEATKLLSTEEHPIARDGVHKLIWAGFLEAEPGRTVEAGNKQCKLIDREKIKKLKVALAKLPEDIKDEIKRRGHPISRLRLAAEHLAAKTDGNAPANGATSEPAKISPIPTAASSANEEAAAGDAPRPADPATKRGRKRGPKTKESTLEIQEFCYVEYRLKGKKGICVALAALREFNGRKGTPKRKAHVTTLANRYAGKFGLPLEPDAAQRAGLLQRWKCGELRTN